MRPGVSTPARRIPLLRLIHPPYSNFPRLSLSTLNTLPSSRPHLPYLSSPSPTRRLAARFVTTETKQWFKNEVKNSIKYTAYIWTFGFLFLVIGYGINQEWTERTYNPPPEWSWHSRNQYKMARWRHDEDAGDHPYVDYAAIGSYYRLLLARLEDPNIDGADLVEQNEGGTLVEGIGRTGYDISNKSEQWRRGYYTALMGAATAAEHLDDCLLSKRLKRVFPRWVVPGPSNPNPRPPPPGVTDLPSEEECEKAYDAPEKFYMRILTTHGFTEKQRVDAALAYATWLDFKGTPNTALDMYKWAFDIATSHAPASSSKPAVDPTTGILNPDAGLPSENVLAVTTALAVHYALTSDVSLALPILLSVLRARRSLPEDPSPRLREENTSAVQALYSLARTVFVHPPFPPPPSDGASPPQRTPSELCEEAGIMANIGEILYSAKKSNTNKEEGLAWTREAVDIAEEQLRTAVLEKEGKKKCKQCLVMALTNWDKMVSRLAKEEREFKAQGGKVGGWLGFGGEEQRAVMGRWASEENVVRERTRRASELLEES